MNRKLHNTASSALVVGTLFALGLAVALAEPAQPQAADAPAAVDAELVIETAAVATAAIHTRQGSRRSSRIRQTMAMPFFSFSSRG